MAIADAPASWAADPYDEASPKPETEPSAVTSQYPAPEGCAARSTTGRAGGLAIEPLAGASPKALTLPLARAIQ